MKKGWRGASNIFEAPMNKSIQNALSIVTFHHTMLDIHKTDGAWQQAMFDDFDPPASSFINMVGTRMGNKVSQVASTDFFKSEFKEMRAKLNKFDSLTRAVHEVDSDEYKMIWGSTRWRFYHGSYNSRLNALSALAKAMTDQGVPPGAAAVLAYRDEINGKRDEQQKYMGKSGVNGLDANALRRILIRKLNKNRSGLMYFFGDDPMCEQMVKLYFPINLLGDRSVKGHHQLIVPKHNFRKIGIHSFKAGEKIEIIISGSDCWICTADDAKRAKKSGYKAINGSKVIIDPSELGDLSKKILVATNDSLTHSCNLIFNILKPKS